MRVRPQGIEARRSRCAADTTGGTWRKP